MPFQNVADGIYKLALAANYTHGSSTTITVADASSLPAAPFLLTLVQSADYGTDDEVSRAFAVTDKTGNVLTAAIADGYTDDTDFTTSDYAELRVLAQSITELNEAVTELQTDKADDDAVVHLTGDETIAGAKTFSSTIVGSVSGNAGTVTTINGRIEAGSNVTITGAGTAASPYSIAAPGGGGGGAVDSVNGQTGVVVLDKTDIGLGNVVNADTTTTANITDSSNKRFVTDAQLTVIGNTSGTNTGDQTSVTGNAGTATALQTARNINGVAFDGTANITVTAAASTLTGTTLASNIVNSSLTSVGTLVNLTVTNTITGSISGNAGTVTTISGHIAAGDGISITGSGTTADPYEIEATGGGGGGSGTVESVALTMPTGFSVSGSPVTTTGTLAVTTALSGIIKAAAGAFSAASAGTDYLAPFGSQTQNYVYASPDGSSGAPTFRALVAADIPSLAASKITSGTLATARGGTGVDGSSAANGQLLIGNGSGYTLATVTAGANISVTNGSGTITVTPSLTPAITSATINAAGAASASAKILTVHGSTSQTGNLIETQNAAGDRLNAMGAGGSLYVAVTNTTASGNVTLTATSTAYQFINPNGSDRDVNLPSVSSGDKGLAFVIFHSGSANALNIKNSGGTLVASITAVFSATLVWDGTTWRWT